MLAALAVFAVTLRIAYKNVTNGHRDIVWACGNVPVVLAGNKVDVKNRQVEACEVCYDALVAFCKMLEPDLSALACAKLVSQLKSSIVDQCTIEI